MTEADILEYTYIHTCTIYGPREGKDDKGWDIFTDEVEYSDIPCAVSFNSLPSSGATDTVQHVDFVAKLFVRPEIDVRAGDTVVANVHGTEYTFLANRPAIYVSHLEVPLMMSEMA